MSEFQATEMAGAAAPAAPHGDIPILVVNADGAPERLVAMWADAERLGLRIERIASEGEDGTFAAHVRAWEHVRANARSGFMIVADDDVSLDERLLPLLDAVMLARTLSQPGLVNLDGGRADAPEPPRILPATQAPRSWGAYLLDARTAGMLLDAIKSAEVVSTLPTFLAGAGAHGIASFVAVPPPVASASSADPTAPEEGGDLLDRVRTRIGRWLGRDKRTATEAPERVDGSVPPMIPSARSYF